MLLESASVEVVMFSLGLDPGSRLVFPFFPALLCILLAPVSGSLKCFCFGFAVWLN